jgi:hypothetical protein
MQSHYRINVSQHGQHLFATDEKSCVSHADFQVVVEEIKKRFPREEGFKINAMFMQCSGYPVFVAQGE